MMGRLRLPAGGCACLRPRSVTYKHTMRVVTLYDSSSKRCDVQLCTHTHDRGCLFTYACIHNITYSVSFLRARYSMHERWIHVTSSSEGV